MVLVLNGFSFEWSFSQFTIMFRVANGFCTTIWSSKMAEGIELTPKLTRLEDTHDLSTSLKFLIRQMEILIDHGGRERSLCYFGELDATSEVWIKLTVYSLDPTKLGAQTLKKFTQCEADDGDLNKDGLWKALGKNPQRIKKLRCSTICDWD
jgi:hypothetical protein